MFNLHKPNRVLVNLSMFKEEVIAHIFEKKVQVVQ